MKLFAIAAATLAAKLEVPMSDNAVAIVDDDQVLPEVEWFRRKKSKYVPKWIKKAVYGFLKKAKNDKNSVGKGDERMTLGSK